MDNNLPLVLVEWNDANTGADDVVTADNIHAFHKPTVVRTLGWLFKEDDEGLTIVNEFYEDCYRGRTFILKVMVKSITPYNLTKLRKPRKVKPKPEIPDLVPT